jgi:hypothetical protein
LAQTIKTVSHFSLCSLKKLEIWNNAYWTAQIAETPREHKCDAIRTHSLQCTAEFYLTMASIGKK